VSGAADALAGRLFKRWAACAILLASCLPLTAIGGAGDSVEPAPVQPDPIQPIVTLRDSGYLLGDLIDERIDLSLPPGVSLDPDSLPLPGRVAPWMEVRASRIEHGEQDGEQRVIVRYQIFAEVEQAERVPIPAFKLRVRDGARTRVVEVPAKSFMLSPALPPTLSDEDRELKSQAPPGLLPVSKTALGLSFSLIAAVLCAAYLLWVHDRLPFLPRAPGPFARLWRSWRRRGRRGLSDDDGLALLHAWHAALNLAAGETLYPSTLSRLFVSAPYLHPLRARIEELFEISWQSFYGPASSRAPAAEELLDMLRHAAERERGVPC
jgi:mxaA protein